MSYILDALKKLEQEKTRKSRTAGKINLAGELFKSGCVHPSKNWQLKTMLLVSVAVLFTFTITYFFLRGKGVLSRVTSLSHATKPTAVVNSPIPIPVPAVPVSSAPAPPASLVPASLPVIPAPALPVSLPSAAKSVVSDEEGERHGSRHTVSKKTISSKTLESSALMPATAPADIKVSGIAWQDERSARRAVVNGFLLREGAVVSGAKIIEILQDRVKFSLSGTSFEVTFISSGTQSAGK
jgi:general secretion pathway protein B